MQYADSPASRAGTTMRTASSASSSAISPSPEASSPPCSSARVSKPSISLATPSPEICKWLPYLTTLNLSRNALTGQIPEDLANCSYLNTLILDDSKLSGGLPYTFSNLQRLKKFSASNNDLSGRLSSFNYGGLELDFGGNSGLCSSPVGKCSGLSKKSLAIIIAAGIFGAAASLLLGFDLWWWYFAGSGKRRKRGYGIGGRDDGGGSSWAERLRAHKLTQVMLFQKLLVKVKLADLLTLTNNFSQENVIVSSRTGTTYKAVLLDGSALAIKRLSLCKIGDKQFRMEMNRLGQFRMDQKPLVCLSYIIRLHGVTYCMV